MINHGKIIKDLQNNYGVSAELVSKLASNLSSGSNVELDKVILTLSTILSQALKERKEVDEAQALLIASNAAKVLNLTAVEKDTGRLNLNGEPIYQKTITVAALGDSGEVTEAHEIGDGETEQLDLTQPIKFVVSIHGSGEVYKKLVTISDIHVDVDDISITSTADLQLYSAFVTLEYSKSAIEV